MILNQQFNQGEFSDWIEEFLPDFSRDLRKVEVPNGFTDVKSIKTLGESSLGVRVFIIETLKDPSGRKVGLAKDSFNLIKNYGTPNALIAYYSENSDNWRFSLLTSTPVWNDGKIITKLSNPKRHSYVLGSNAKVNTPTKFLIKKGKALDFTDLKSRFSLEVVNKEFYKEISECYTKLVGGTRGEGVNIKSYESLLKLPSVNDYSQTSIEFAVRLIGRIIFCWFLKEKLSDTGKALMPKELLSLNAISTYEDYYHMVLEPIFFEVLNKQNKSRKDLYTGEPFSVIPYLNGGLFSPHDDDFFSYNENKQAQYHNTVTVPDKWLKEFFGILETYNFTIDENTSIDEDLSIDPEMLGRIFENLLAEINPETGESARKSTGSFYTPRAIVDYMIDESLLQYLKHKTKIDEEKLRAIISYDLSDDSSYPLSNEDKNNLVNAIEEVKILDPACGSGAYPMGALQKIVFILQQIDPDGQIWFHKQIQHTSPEIRYIIEREFSHKNFDYIRKLGLIRENIYGIDIQSIATEISRLRCFLTLVVDERIDDGLENRGIEPLPNLDFKFVTANSLIGLPTTGKQNQIGLFEDTEGISELREIRDMFFNASGSEREMLKLQFMQSQKNMLHRLISENRRGHADLTTMLTTWDPFSHKSSTWFDPEWMFGVKEGFDIVIGNPPYVQLQKNEGFFATLYEKSNYFTYARTGDIYCLFYEKGLSLTKINSGLLCFITSNKWLRTSYGKNLRSYLSTRNPLILIDFGGFKVFESATVDTSVLTIQNADNKDQLVACHFKNDYKKGDSLIAYFNNNKSLFKKPNKEIWLIISPSKDVIKQKIERLGKRLGEWKLNINYGIKTGLNKAYIINQVEYDQIIMSDQNAANIIKPLLRGRDVMKYCHAWSNLYLINVHNGYTDSSGNRVKPIEIEMYPTVKEHLDKYKSKLIERDDQGVTPYNLRNCAYLEEFEKEKIIWQEIAQDNKFFLDSENFFCNDTARILTGRNIKFLVAFLNSKFFHFGFKNYYAGGGLGSHGIRYKSTFMENFPVIDPESISEKSKNKIELLADQIIEKTRSNNYLNDTNKQNQVKSLETEIDLELYRLYELTEEEIEIIEGENKNETN